MLKMNLKKVYVVDDEEGNPHGFGPGDTEVPEWALERLKARGVNLEAAPVAEPLPEVPGLVGLPQSPGADGNVLTAPGDGIEKTAIELPAAGIEREVDPGADTAKIVKKDGGK